MPTTAGMGGHATPHPQPSQILTRANKALEQPPMYEELIKMNKDSTTMAVQVQEFLEKEGYALPDARGGKAMLSYTLLLLLHPAPPNLLSKGIRAVTTL